MSDSARRWATAVVLVLASAAPEARPDELLPALSVHLAAARYEPTETDFHWTGWIGGGARLLELGRTAAYVTADVETQLGEERRPFEANQVNYHLEVGARRPLGHAELAVFYHHVSRHAVDREKPEAVDWNLLGVRARFRFPSALDLPGHARLSIARATLASRVGYRWEVLAALEGALLTRGWGEIYVRTGARVVTAEASPDLPRDGFVDGLLEAGLRFSGGPRALDLFAAYERRNDVFLLVPGGRSRALLGIRFSLEGQRPGL